MAALRARPTVASLRASHEAAAGGASWAPRCGAMPCAWKPAATPRCSRFKPVAAGRRMRFTVSASDRQVEDWEPLETPRSPPARLPQPPLPPLPPPPPLARSGVSDTMKAAAAAAAVLLLFAAREFTSDSTRLWSQVLPVVDGGGVDIARIRKDGDMMVVDSVNYGELAFEKDSQGNILFTDQAGVLYLTTAKLGNPVVYRIGRVDDLTPETLRSTLTAIRVLGAEPTEEMIQQALSRK